MTAASRLPKVEVRDLEFDGRNLDVSAATRVFDDVGIVILRGLMPETARAILVDVERAVAVANTEKDRLVRAPYGWHAPSGAIFSDHPKELNPAPGEKQLIVAPINHATSDALRRSAEDPHVHELLHAIFRSEPHALGTGQCMYKEAHGGAAMNLHQDAIYAGEGYQDVITVYTYLVPTTLQGGCIEVIPYSHRLGIAARRDEYVDEGLPAHVCDWRDALSIPGEPGDTILWHYLTVHGSKPNMSATPRPSVLTRYGTTREAELMRAGVPQW